METNPATRGPTIRRRLWRAFHSYVTGLYRRIDEDHVFLHASGLAFSVFICLIPLVLVVFSVLGVLVERPVIVNEVHSFIDRAIPYKEYADVVREFVFERVREFRLYKNVAGIIGITGLFFAASGLFSSMRTILNVAFRIDASPSILASKFRDFGMVVLVLGYFLLAAAVIPVAEIIAGFALEAQFLGEGAELVSDAILRFGSFLLVLTAFMLMYRFVPTKAVPWKVVAISAVSTAFLLLAAQILFGVYIKNAVTLQRIYGAYMIGIAAVFWIYASSIVFILGAEIGQLYRERSDPEHRSDATGL